MSPVLTDAEITFVLPDPDRRYQEVTLYQELQRPRESPVATWADGEWRARLPRVDQAPKGPKRMEYAFVVTHPDGGKEFITDPGNPVVADGPFGAKSVLQFPTYQPPAWLQAEAPAGGFGHIEWSEIPLSRYRSAVTCGVWTPAGHNRDDELPLLLVHDGPEFDELSRLTHLLALAVAEGRIPPMRAALLAPVPNRRNETYSASAHYADALATRVVPHLDHHAPSPADDRPAVMGASLGALAALHAAHRHPATFGDLVLLSGSYFRMRSDHQERGFAHFNRISRFVGRVATGRATLPVRTIAISVGTVEENYVNNQIMASGLEAAGHDVRLTTFADGHTYTAWRDALDPVLLDVLADGMSARRSTL
ncbi:alpha/beta hydrolase [Euzebya tangerina]|uniref:alpha/beta hydrolase n=1 Tax=Euzebya tangerina TaxID=591198 RepID=UPI0013C2CD64|nr:alpha/beta hydrolase-fold protein [Euzebya tangerina]